MSIEYYFEKDSSLLVEAWVGIVTQSEWIDYLYRVLAEVENSYLRKHIIDLRFGSIGFTPDACAVQDACAHLSSRKTGFSRRNIAVLSGTGFRRLDQFERLIQAWQDSFVVFNHIDTACHWLDIDPAKTECTIHQMRKNLFLQQAADGDLPLEWENPYAIPRGDDPRSGIKKMRLAEAIECAEKNN